MGTTSSSISAETPLGKHRAPSKRATSAPPPIFYHRDYVDGSHGINALSGQEPSQRASSDVASPVVERRTLPPTPTALLPPLHPRPVSVSARERDHRRPLAVLTRTHSPHTEAEDQENVRPQHANAAPPAALTVHKAQKLSGNMQALAIDQIDWPATTSKPAAPGAPRDPLSVVFGPIHAATAEPLLDENYERVHRNWQPDLSKPLGTTRHDFLPFGEVRHPS